MSGETMSAVRAADPHARALRAQRVFRAIMNAMARPGSIVAVEPEPAAPDGLEATLAAIVLTLADFETPVWLDAGLCQDPRVAEFIRFQAGAPIVGDPARCAFAIVSDAARMPPLSDFAQGEPAYPDRSTTVVVAVAALTSNGLRLLGPGVDGIVRLGFSPQPANFVAGLVANRARFPLGVDLVLVAPGCVAALPRSTVVAEDPACT
jgi:alpha-D-ribose 1-methylphosphonate 5-triphosphate synthase subunit PhnH